MAALNTAIFVQGKQDPWEIYNTALQQILFYQGRKVAPADIQYHLHSEEDGREVLYASPHENLPVMLAVYHRPGGEMYTEEEAGEKLATACGDKDCASHRAQPAHLIVALATSVFWCDEDREWNAGNLHSGMVWSIGGFLDSKKIPWKWQVNTSPDVHEGYGSMDELVATVERARTGMSSPLGVAQVMAREFMKRMGLLPEDD